MPDGQRPIIDRELNEMELCAGLEHDRKGGDVIRLVAEVRRLRSALDQVAAVARAATEPGPDVDETFERRRP